MSGKPLLDVSEAEWAIVKTVLQRHVPDREVWAFGSRAKWTAKEFSDLDLTILGQHPLSPGVSAALADDFTDSDLPWKVDVVDWATTSESFRRIIERDKVVVQMPAQRGSGKGGVGVSAGWSQGKLGDFIELKRGYDLPQAKRLTGSVPLVSSSGVSDQHSIAMVKGPGVITGRYGTIGQVFFVDEDFWPLNTTLYVRDFKGNFPKFIHYFLKTVDFFAYSDKAAVPGVNRNHLHEALVTLPPLVLQKEIAGVLGAFDDRINLLRETNATLEAIAQTLFKSWFVDFDPVRAKMEGRSPEGMDEATAALFPDGFEASGEVPRGWHSSKLLDVCSYLNRGLSPKYVEEGGVLVLNQKCIRDFSVDYTKGRRHDPLQRKIEGRSLVVGDVLVNSTGVGTLGRVAQVLDLPEPAIVDSHVTVVRANDMLSWPYLGQWMARKQSEIEAMGEGSTGQTELSRAKLGAMQILRPPAHVLSAFDSMVTPLKNRLALNERAMQTLAAVRDTLLPRLISGQLLIPEAEPVVMETP